MLEHARSARFFPLILMACVAPAAAQSQLLARHFPHGPTVENPTGFHVLLRKPPDKLIYDLGERVELEAACTSDVAAQYSSECHVDLEISPAGAGAEVAADPIDTQWISGVLCPGTIIGMCGSFTVPPDHPLTSEEVWVSAWPRKHLPVSSGRFNVRAMVLGFNRATDQIVQATSLPVEIEIADDPTWSAQIFQQALSATPPDGYDLVSLFPEVKTMQWLLSRQGFRAYGYPAANNDKVRLIEMFPDRAAAAALLTDDLKHEIEGYTISDVLEEILAMQLAAEEPELYGQVTPTFILSSDQTDQLRQWVLVRRRALLLELGKSLERNYADLRLQDPDDPDMDDLESKAKAIVDLSISHCASDHDSVLSPAELEQFMRRAHLSPQFIAKQLARIRTQEQ